MKMRIAYFAGLLTTSALALCALTAKAQTAGYDQPYRPQVHFSPRQHWTNDPNGLVYFHGEYHLFFQYNPLGDQWGHMSWGHAVSTDLLHWHELPVAIPETDAGMAYTGSIVVDTRNSSGFCAPKSECLVAIYTIDKDAAHRETQNVAYSRDNGRTWTPFAGNPVLDLHLRDFRDPSVTWNEQSQQWIMVVSLPDQHKVRFYASPDLKKWTELNDFGPAGDTAGVWECPSLIEIPGSKNKNSIWALKVGLNPGAPQGGSGEQYFLGSFDGKSFTPSDKPGAHGWTNYGKDDYCAISFNGLPEKQNPILLGWMSNWQYAKEMPTSPWRGQMSLARRLSWLEDEAGFALKQEPITQPVRGAVTRISAASNGTKTIASAPIPYELDLQFDSPTEQLFGIRLYSDAEHWTEIGFDRNKAQFYIDRTRSGAAVGPDFLTKTVAPLVANRPYDLRLIVDRSSVEAYAQNGTIAMTDLIYPPTKNSRIELFSGSGKSVVVKGKSWKLKSIWGD